jgi:hypothetical protein
MTENRLSEDRQNLPATPSSMALFYQIAAVVKALSIDTRTPFILYINYTKGIAVR